MKGAAAAHLLSQICKVFFFFLNLARKAERKKNFCASHKQPPSNQSADIKKHATKPLSDGWIFLEQGPQTPSPDYSRPTHAGPLRTGHPPTQQPLPSSGLWLTFSGRSRQGSFPPVSPSLGKPPHRWAVGSGSGGAASVDPLTEHSFGFQPRLLQLWREEVSLCRGNLRLVHPQALGLGEPLALHLPQASCAL